jgi:hypothetical protein
MKEWVFLALLVVAAVAETDKAASAEPAATEEFAERAVFEVGQILGGGCTLMTVAVPQQGPGQLGNLPQGCDMLLLVS